MLYCVVLYFCFSGEDGRDGKGREEGGGKEGGRVMKA